MSNTGQHLKKYIEIAQIERINKILWAKISFSTILIFIGYPILGLFLLAFVLYSNQDLKALKKEQIHAPKVLPFKKEIQEYTKEDHIWKDFVQEVKDFYSFPTFRKLIKKP